MGDGGLLALAVSVGVGIAGLVIALVALGASLIALRRSKVEYRVLPVDASATDKIEKELNKISNPAKEDFKGDFQALGVDPDDLV